MLVVLDTNVVVSGLWTPNGKAAQILNEVIAGKLRLCYDYRILTEYREVLTRPKFKFSTWQVDFLLEAFEKEGISVIAPSLSQVPFTDESDRAFYEVAKFCVVPLVTGNLKHFPEDDCVTTLASFYSRLTSAESAELGH